MTLEKIIFILKNIFKKKNVSMGIQMLRFGSVGIFGVSINYITFFLLLEFLNVNYLIAGIISFLVPVPFVFLTNKMWTFNSNVSNVAGLPSYLMVCFLGLSGHTTVLFIVTDFLKINPLISQIPAIMTSASINFLLAKFVVFKNLK